MTLLYVCFSKKQFSGKITIFIQAGEFEEEFVLSPSGDPVVDHLSVFPKRQRYISKQLKESLKLLIQDLKAS